MNGRERFEEWQSKALEVWGLVPVPWQAWQAAEHQAFERAAQICENFESDLSYGEYAGSDTDTYPETAKRCARMIRALIQDASSGKDPK
jgi:hypothetical protein